MKKLCIALICAPLLVLSPQITHAFDVGSIVKVVAKASLEQAKLENDIHYLDTEGRMEFFKQMKEKNGISYEPKSNKLVSRIVKRISTPLSKQEKSVATYPFNYFVNPDITYNAFCSLGHNMSINIGLINFLNYNEDELAVVIGHEMGHGVKNHMLASAKKSFPINLLKSIYDSQNNSAISAISSDIISNHMHAKGITKGQEKEADALDFDYTVAAGYNIGAGAALWQRFLDKELSHKQNFIGELLSPNDHPKIEDRRYYYAKQLTTFSKNHISVDTKKEGVLINNKFAFTPSEVGDMSSNERAYLIAGNLAAVYHNNSNIPNAVLKGNYIYMGNQPIMSITKKDDATKIIKSINSLK